MDRSPTRHRRAAGALIALALAFPGAFPAPSARRGEKIGTWQCGRWTPRQGRSSGSRWCVRFSKITPIIRRDGQDLLHNSFKKPQTMHCSLSTGTILAFHAEGTVEAEAGVIFAKATASVTAGGSTSTTTTSATGAEFRVKGRSWAYCARGHAAFRVVGKTRKELCGPPGCRTYAGTKINTTLPSSPFFDIGPGRNIQWRRFLPAA